MRSQLEVASGRTRRSAARKRRAGAVKTVAESGMEGEVFIRAGGGGINRLSAGAKGVRHPYMRDDSSVVFDLSAALFVGSMVQELDCGAVSFVCGGDGGDSGCFLAASRGEYGSGVWAF